VTTVDFENVGLWIINRITTKRPPTTRQVSEELKSEVTRRVSSVHKNAVVGLTKDTWNRHRRDLFAYWKSRGVDFARLPTQNIDESRLEACTKENLFAFYFYCKHLLESDPPASM